MDVQKSPEKKSPKSCFTRIASKCSKKLQKKHYAYSDQELGRTRSPVLHPARRHQSVLPPQGFPIRRWHGPFKPTPNVPFCIQQLKNIGQIRYIFMYHLNKFIWYEQNQAWKGSHWYCWEALVTSFTSLARILSPTPSLPVKLPIRDPTWPWHRWETVPAKRNTGAWHEHLQTWQKLTEDWRFKECRFEGWWVWKVSIRKHPLGQISSSEMCWKIVFGCKTPSHYANKLRHYRVDPSKLCICSQRPYNLHGIQLTRANVSWCCELVYGLHTLAWIRLA